MTSKLTKFSTFLLLLGLVILNNGCKNDTGSTGNDTSIKKVSDYPNEVVYEWNELFLKIERYAAGYRPGPAPTALGYMGFAVYEATAPGFSEYKSIQNNFPEINIPKIEDGKEFHWPTVVNAFYGTMMPRFFVDQPQEHKGWMTNLDARLLKKYRDEASAEVIERSRKRGQEVGEAVWKWFTSDPVAYNHYKTHSRGMTGRRIIKKKEIGNLLLRDQTNQWVVFMDDAELSFYKGMQKKLRENPYHTVQIKTPHTMARLMRY
ncbi:MAG: hypothetical protein IPG87_00495 [Saprospiraceae bacterium]|nr:hypothetical protein [Candidatus Vicinibacter affinis]